MRESEAAWVYRAGSKRPAVGDPGVPSCPTCCPGQAGSDSDGVGRSRQRPGQGDELGDPYGARSAATLLRAAGRVKGRPTGLLF